MTLCSLFLLTAIFWPPNQASGVLLEATTITFDDRASGTRITNQYPGVTFPDGGFIRAASALGLSTRSSPNAFEKDCTGVEFDSAPLRIQFATPQGYVRVYVGNSSGTSQRAVMRAYNATTGGSLIASTEVTLGARASVTRPMEVCRAVARDIRRVEITVGNAICEVIDDLTYDPGPPLGTINTVNFDDRSTSTRITNQYAGLTFPDAPWIRSASSLGLTTISPPNVLEQYSFGSEFNPAPLRIQLTSPQAWVRVRVGNRAPNSQRLTMRAYSTTTGGTPFATVFAEFSARSSIVTPLEVCRFVERDIRRVEIEHSGPDFEVIDDFQFAGVAPPPPPPDREAPRGFIDSPTNGAFFFQNTPADRPSIAVRGRITENRGLQRVTLTQEPLDGGARFEEPNLLTYVTGSAPNFRFEYTIRLSPGRNRIRVEATDTAGNRSTNPEREITVTLAPPMEVIIDSPRPNQVFSNSRITIEGRVRKQLGVLPRERVRLQVTDLPGGSRSTSVTPVDSLTGAVPEFRFRAFINLWDGFIDQSNTIFIEATSEDGKIARASVAVVYSLPDTLIASCRSYGL